MTQSKDDDIIISADDNLVIDIEDYLADTIDISNITLTTPTYTVDTGSYSMNDGTDTFTLSDTISLDEGLIDSLTNITFDRVIFEDHMPDPDRIKKMCQHYPALDKAYENFKTIYKMVNQDYKGNYEDDEDIPF